MSQSRRLKLTARRLIIVLCAAIATVAFYATWKTWIAFPSLAELPKRGDLIEAGADALVWRGFTCHRRVLAAPDDTYEGEQFQRLLDEHASVIACHKSRKRLLGQDTMAVLLVGPDGGRISDVFYLKYSM